MHTILLIEEDLGISMKEKQLRHFIASYGIQVSSSIHIIQWVNYHKDHHKVMLKGSVFQTLVFIKDLI